MTDVVIPAWVNGTLHPVEKLEAHKRGLKHKAVSVFVIAGNAVLIQQRAAHKYHTPRLWANTCCTHPKWDEAPKTCAGWMKSLEFLDKLRYIATLWSIVPMWVAV